MNTTSHADLLAADPYCDNHLALATKIETELDGAGNFWVWRTCGLDR